VTEATQLAGLPAHVSAPDPNLYWSDNYVVLDFETTTELKGSPLARGNRIVLACWQHVHSGRSVAVRKPHDNPVRYIFGGEYDLGELTEAIRAADFVVAHNAKFELGWLRRCGVDLRGVVCFDTMIADYVLGGNTYNLNHLSLAACLERHGLKGKGDTVGLMLKSGVPTEEIPEEWLLRYCIRDVEAAGELFLLQRGALREAGLEAVNYQRNLVTPALTDMEFRGMQLDDEVVMSYLGQQEKRYEELTRELQDFCGGASPASAQQMREFIYTELKFGVPTDFRGRPHLTPNGAPSVAAPVVEALVAKTKRQTEFLLLHTEWRRLHSDLTKYLRKFGECVREDGGRLHGSFNQTTTRTHRLSSSGHKHRIQFQNFNREFKPFFRARHAGWLLGEADGAQLEFRTAAHLGSDAVALADIVSGADIHKYTASVLNGVPEERVTSDMRQAAKNNTFKPLYGGSSGSPAERAYYDAFKAKYYSIADTQQGWTQQVLRDKQLTTEWGMIYYWPDTRLCTSGYITNTTSIYNYPVQAFATAEIIPCALVAAWHRMSGMKSFLVNTVHDSIISELHPEEVQQWHAIARQCLIEDVYVMIKKLYGIDITIPLGAGVMVGKNWADKEAKNSEIVYDAPKELWEQAAKERGML
jgi:DNA polymerase I-like protein with 3'-5' exonuclease and polymerase domains